MYTCITGTSTAVRERADEGGGAGVQQHPSAAVRAGGPPGAQAELPVRAQAGVPVRPQAAVPDQAQGAVPAGMLPHIIMYYLYRADGVDGPQEMERN